MKGNIPYFDCYHVTRSGDVYSKYKDKVTWRKMAKRKKNNGYIIVSLRNNDGVKYTFNIQIKAKYKISIMTMYKYFNERGVIWKKVKR